MGLPRCVKKLFCVQPLIDSRWTGFLQRHGNSSVFHTVPWLKALTDTYGYEPLAFTTSPAGEPLRNAAVFCRIESFLTGRRLVSLPFSDHCDLLIDDPADYTTLVSTLRQELQQHKLRYVELRPAHAAGPADLGIHSTTNCWLHHIDLDPDLDTLYGNFHKDSIQRKIRRAEREALRYEEGRTAALLDTFYALMISTRRRHGIPPQPKRWFQSLVQHLGEDLKIRVVYQTNSPVAAILTLRYKDMMVYKYGASDSNLHPLGGMPLLMWKAIQDAKRAGLRILDLGRTDLEDTGLITFKERFGAKGTMLTYFRLLPSQHAKGTYTSRQAGWTGSLTKRVFQYLPDWAFRSAGSLLYRHIG